MNTDTLQVFINKCKTKIEHADCPADCVAAITPAMHNLLISDISFLKPEHYASDPAHYSRNAIYIADDDSVSLYALVWLPGQWTPIHDHGTWGVVGILEGNLQERNFVRTDTDAHTHNNINQGIQLARGGSILLAPGSVTSFVPNPDHIHITGNADTKMRVVSLHLYGQAMSGFHVYDKDYGTRKWINVAHNES